MIELPLYPATVRAEVEKFEPQDCSTECDQCELHKKARNVCIQADAEEYTGPGGLLIVAEHPGMEEDRRNRALCPVGTGKHVRSGKLIRRLVRANWAGSVIFDQAVRCYPGARRDDKKKKKIVTACRGYLNSVIEESQPSRIIVMGPWAIYSVLGRAVPVWSARRGHSFLSNGTPVFILPEPEAAHDNRIQREWFEEDFKWALSANVKARWNDITYVVEDADDSDEAVNALGEAEWISFDVETAGLMHNDDFEVLSVSLFDNNDNSYVWDKRALKIPDVLDSLRWLFSQEQIGWVAHNIKYDAMAIWILLGVLIKKFDADTAVWRRLLAANCDARLEVASELIGMGGHKEEADGFMAKEVRRVTKKKPGPIDDDKVKYVEAIKNLPKRAKKATYSYGLLPDEVRNRYNARDTTTTALIRDYFKWQLDAEPRIKNVWEKFSKPGLKALLKMEHWGVAADRDALELFHTTLTMQLASIRPHFDHYNKLFDGCFNPDSAAHVQKLLFKHLGLHPVKHSKKTGRPSADKEVLNGMLGQHPIIEHIIEWRRIAKLDGTYARGMLQHIRSDGRMHPTYRIDGTETGRISGANPNLLNIPRSETREGKMAKNVFRASPGCTLVQLDYSQQELRVAAMLSGDEVMIAVFVAGEDLHWFTAREIAQMAWGISRDDVTEAHRTFAKSVIFGLIYGKTDQGLSEQLGISVDDAKKIRKLILGRFTKLRAYIKEQLNLGRRDGGVWIPWDDETARWRPLPQIVSKADKYFMQKITAENATINTPVQGRASDYCLASVIELVDWVEREHVPGKLVLSVYDSIIFDVETWAIDEVVEQSRDIMLSWPSGGVPLKVDVEVGDQWGNLEKYKAAA